MLRRWQLRLMKLTVIGGTHGTVGGSGAARGEGAKGGSFFLWVDVQKLCNMCVQCSKCVSFWGTSYTPDPLYTHT